MAGAGQGLAERVKKREVDSAPPSRMVTVMVTGSPAETQGGALHVTALRLPEFEGDSRVPTLASHSNVSSFGSSSSAVTLNKTESAAMTAVADCELSVRVGAVLNPQRRGWR
jgi:hypothetical protein